MQIWKIKMIIFFKNIQYLYNVSVRKVKEYIRIMLGM